MTAIALSLVSTGAMANYTTTQQVRATLAATYTGIDAGSWATSTGRTALGTLAHSIDDRLRTVTGPDRCFTGALSTLCLPGATQRIGHTNIDTITTNVNSLSTAVVNDITAGLTTHDSATNRYTGSGLLIAKVNNVLAASDDVATAAARSNITVAELDRLITAQETAYTSLSTAVTSASSAITGVNSVVTALGGTNENRFDAYVLDGDGASVAQRAAQSTATDNVASIWNGNRFYRSYTMWTTNTIETRTMPVTLSHLGSPVDFQAIPYGYEVVQRGGTGADAEDVLLRKVGSEAATWHVLGNGTNDSLATLEGAVTTAFQPGGAFAGGR